ncbi:hypothetical protein D5018_06085 [Parashewanella curva]|uniref:Uncharacterized protein n=1 Tax=Parashewanella curva TaxID=2338552 RepID=A0A3L8Q1B9_9GAMM|nr:hypothetical protein [Parashewanella curva]RLV60513.1 hypothetical protein D5018_06085 [Parashewanella curva]
MSATIQGTLRSSPDYNSTELDAYPFRHSPEAIKSRPVQDGVQMQKEALSSEDSPHPHPSAMFTTNLQRVRVNRLSARDVVRHNNIRPLKAANFAVQQNRHAQELQKKLGELTNQRSKLTKRNGRTDGRLSAINHQINETVRKLQEAQATVKFLNNR